MNLWNVLYLWNTLSMKCPVSEITSMKFPIFEMYYQINVLSMKCPIYKMTLYKNDPTPSNRSVLLCRWSMIDISNDIFSIMKLVVLKILLKRFKYYFLNTFRLTSKLTSRKMLKIHEKKNCKSVMFFIFYVEEKILKFWPTIKS